MSEQKVAEADALRSQVAALLSAMEEERKAKAEALAALMADLELHGTAG